MNNTILAFLPLNDADALDLTPDAYDDFTGDGGTAMFSHSGHKLTVSKVDAALRPELVEAGMANNPLHGCNADRLTRSNAHLIIHAIPNGEDAEALKEAASTVTEVISDIAEDNDVLGVFWAHSNALYSVGDLKEAMTQLDQGAWPVKFWVGLRPAGTSSGVELRTTGAEFFLGREFVMQGPADKGLDLYLTMLSILNYMFETGAVIEPGSNVAFPNGSTLSASADGDGAVELSVRE